MPSGVIEELIARIVKGIKRGKKIQTGTAYTGIYQDLDAWFLEVDPANISDYFGMALRYYNGKGFDAIQLVWPDSKNCFPWQEGFNFWYMYAQPLLDRNVGFKFRERKNLLVYTTMQ